MPIHKRFYLLLAAPAAVGKALAGTSLAFAMTLACIVTAFAGYHAPGAAKESNLVIAASDFSSRMISDAQLGEVSWHLDRTNSDTAGPLIVWLPGSGAMPHFQTFSDGFSGYSFPRELFKYRENAHFLLVDKPGIPFEAEIEFDEERGRPVPLDGPEYASGIALNTLVERNALAISAARAELGSRMTSLVIVGGSEGGQYTFRLARLTQADLAIVWGGIALPQYFDFVIENRLAAERGEITRAAAQAEVEKLYSAYADIAADPMSTEKSFNGAPYRRWSGLGTYSAIDDMLGLEVPLLMIQGGADDKAPILNSDYAKIAFIAAGKSNLDYWVYPDADHSMRVPSQDGSSTKVSIAADVWDRAWAWIGCQLKRKDSFPYQDTPVCE